MLLMYVRYLDETYRKIQEDMHMIVHMCMIVATKYIQIHSDMHTGKCAYLNVYRHKIQSDTKYYKQICTSTMVHICRYEDSKYIQIHADMHQICTSAKVHI